MFSVTPTALRFANLKVQHIGMGPEFPFTLSIQTHQFFYDKSGTAADK